MSIADTLRSFLTEHGVEYDLVHHSHTAGSMETAEAAHVSGERLAKAVVLGDEDGYLMAVLPATHRLQLGWVHRTLNRNLGLVTEEELRSLFTDCDLGAIPACGTPYGLKMVVDDSLKDQPEVFFEAGDHEDLVHMSAGQYQKLTQGAEFGRFSQHT
jgi:Ala-tRNA(Pro) deacylase